MALPLALALEYFLAAFVPDLEPAAADAATDGIIVGMIFFPLAVEIDRIKNCAERRTINMNIGDKWSCLLRDLYLYGAEKEQGGRCEKFESREVMKAAQPTVDSIPR